MPVKIRLQRRGRKFAKIYNIVVADGRAPRDGKYIETLGQYNPVTNPATIILDFDRTLDWLQKGAQPTDTCRAILSFKGVMYKKHLLEGVKKGAFDEAEAERRFEAWVKDKDAKIQGKKDKMKSDEEAAKKARLDAEVKINEARALEIQKQRAELLKEAGSSDDDASESDNTTEEAPAAEVQTEEVKAEEPTVESVAEEVKPETVEAPAAEPAEVPEAEKTEEKEATGEAKEEPVAEEPKKDDSSEEVKQ